MNTDKLEKIINENFEKKEKVNQSRIKKLLKQLMKRLNLVDQGKIRVANKIGGIGLLINGLKKQYF